MSELFESAPEVKFEDLVGEGKKFRDTDAVAKKIVHADQHIENLERTLSEMRVELQSRLTVEEMLEKINKPTSPAVQPPNREALDTNRQEPGIDIADEISKALKTEKEKERREANLNTVRKGLKERFGADYNQKLTSIADNLSISKDFLTSMAQTSPEGFMKLIDSVAKPDSNRPLVPPMGSDLNRVNNLSGEKNQSYYAALRREKPDVYFSAKVQKEIHDQAVKLGPAFYQ